MKALEVLGLLVCVAAAGFVVYKVDQLDKGQDDTLDRLDKMEQDAALMHATSHRALLGTPDDRDDLRREYQAVYSAQKDIFEED